MNRLYRLVNFWKENILNRAIIITASILIMVVLAFGIYYYRDRYIHPNDLPLSLMNITAMEKSVREDPANPHLRVNLALFYYENEQYQEAKDQVIQVITLYPEDENALYLAGLSDYQLQNFDQAAQYLEQFINLRKQKSNTRTDRFLETALYTLGCDYIQSGQPQKAIPVLLELLENNHMDADALYQLGTAYSLENRHQEAIEQFLKAVAFVPDFNEVYTAMITSYAALDEEALVLYAQGMSAFCTGDYPTAVDKLEQSANNLVDFSPVFLGLGLTYEKIGDYLQAQDCLEKALTLDPENYAAAQALGRVQQKISSQN